MTKDALSVLAVVLCLASAGLSVWSMALARRSLRLLDEAEEARRVQKEGGR